MKEENLQNNDLQLKPEIQTGMFAGHVTQCPSCGRSGMKDAELFLVCNACGASISKRKKPTRRYVEEENASDSGADEPKS